MFAWWGRTVYRFRYIVIGVMVALCLGGGVYGMSLGQHVTQSGFYDEGSQSVHASLLADEAYGRDRASHVVGDPDAAGRQKGHRPAWMRRSPASSTRGRRQPRPDVSWVGWLRPPTPPETVQQMKTEDGRRRSSASRSRVRTTTRS